MVKRSLLVFVLPFLLFVVFQYLYSPPLGEQFRKRPGFDIIAHRGVSPNYSKEDMDDHTCTASRISKPRHDYIENSLESIQAAFDFGATIVEIDIRPTKDNQLVVFHDDTLDCRTNAHGNVWDYAVAELKRLDVGYGYTYDGGRTYPFRGKGFGKIHTLNEVLSRFPHRKFLIDNKNGNNLEVAEMLVRSLSRLSADQQRNIVLWSQDGAFEYVNKKLPGIKRLLLPRHRQKKYFLAYLFSFGTMKPGPEYRDQGLGLPVEYVKYVWGWPGRLLNKVYGGGARFYLYVNDVGGIDRVMSETPLDGIVTDNVDIIGPYLRARVKKPD